MFLVTRWFISTWWFRPQADSSTQTQISLLTKIETMDKKTHLKFWPRSDIYQSLKAHFPLVRMKSQDMCLGTIVCCWAASSQWQFQIMKKEAQILLQSPLSFLHRSCGVCCFITLCHFIWWILTQPSNYAQA